MWYIYIFRILICIFMGNYIRFGRINKLIAVLPVFQRSSICEVLLGVLVTLVSQVGSDREGDVD